MSFKRFIEVLKDDSKRDLLFWGFIAATLISGTTISCNDGNRKGAGTPQASAVKAAVEAMTAPLASIDKEADAIVKQAPETKPHTDAIGGETGKLRVVQGQLEAAQATIKANEKDCAELVGKVVGLEKQVGTLRVDLDKARAEKNSLMARFLAVVGGLALVAGVPLAIFLARSVPLALLCGSVFGLAVAGQVVLEYRLHIAIGVGVLIVGAVLWLVLLQRKSLVEVFKSVDPHLPRDSAGKVLAHVKESIAEAQSKVTQGVFAAWQAGEKKRSARLSSKGISNNAVPPFPTGGG